MRIKSIWFFPIIILLFVHVCAYAQKYTDLDSLHYWFSCAQTKDGLVIAEDKDNFTVEEEALSVLVFLQRGHFHRAERILDFFQRLKKKVSQADDFHGFYRYYQVNGEPLSSEILSNTQLWLMLAINEYTRVTEDRKFLPLANDLAKIVLGMEGAEFGIAAGFWEKTPLTYFNASDNLLAISVFPKLWKLTGLREYRYATWRTHQFIQRFLWDKEKKNFKRKTYLSEYDISDSLFSTLIYGESYVGWAMFEKPTDLYNQILIALLYSSVYNEKEKSKAILDAIGKNILWSKKYPGAAGLPVVSEGEGIDIFTSAWYLLSRDTVNPLMTDQEFWNNKVVLPPSERQFKGDDFEQGLIKTLLAYPSELFEAVNCRVIVDWEKEELKSGKGALRIYFSPEAGAKSAEATVTRRFLESQDLAPFSTVKIWLKAMTNERIFQYKLKVTLGIIDSDGELWISPELSIVSRKGFLNSFPFPNGWKRAPKSTGNNVFDVERVKELKFLIEQPSDTPWQIYLDDLSFE